MTKHRPRPRRARSLLAASAGLVAVSAFSLASGCGDQYIGNPFPPQPDLSATVDLNQLDGNPLPPCQFLGTCPEGGVEDGGSGD